MEATTITAVASAINESDNGTTVPRALGIVIGIFDIVVGSIGNLLTLLAIWNNRRLHKPFYFFIANLCVIDFLTATVMMPFNVRSYVTKSWEPFGDFACSFMAFSYYSCGYSSISCLIAITVNRFVGVVYQEMYDEIFTRKRVVIIIAITWIFAPAFLSPFFFIDGFAWNQNVTLCVFNTSSMVAKDSMVVKDYMQFIRALFQLFPLVIMVSLYTKIFLTSKQSGKAVIQISMRNENDVSFRGRCRTASGTMRRPNCQGSPFLDRVRGALKSSSTSALSPQKLNNNYCLSSTDHCVTNNLQDSECYDRKYKNKHPTSADTDECERTCPMAISPRVKKLCQTESLLHKSDSCLQSPKRCLESDSVFNWTVSPLYSPKSRCNNDLQFNFKEKCSSEPNSPLFGVRKVINSRSLFTSESQHGSTSSSQHLNSVSSGGKRTPNLFNGSSNLKRSWTSQRSNAPYSSFLRLEEKRRKSMDRRLLRISVTICTVFTILFLPSVVINFFDVKHPGIHMMASIVTWLNSCFNPIIYCFMCTKMREQYRELLKKFASAICRCIHFEKDDYWKARQSFKSSTHRRKQ